MIKSLIDLFWEDVMSRNSKLISENLREEIAKELGVYDQVKQDGGSWANVSSKQCGNIVSKAIEIANRSVENKKPLDIPVAFILSYKKNSCKKSKLSI